MLRRAYTVIELLICVALIATMSALLLPGISMLRAGVNNIRCQDHLRQTGMAFEAFAADHNGLMPKEGNKGEDDPAMSWAWFYRLPPYLDGETVQDRQSILQCPLHVHSVPEHFDHASPKSYKMNGYLDNGGRREQVRLGRWSDCGSVEQCGNRN